MFERNVDRVVLIPGFFGFGSFGSGQERLEYFQDVIDELGHAVGLPREHIHVHEPPPTGALRSRVASLCERLLAVIGEDTLRGTGRARIHLVGHSTGGLDARLLVNPGYREWKQPPPDVLAALRARVGTVATISAPLRGTPLAANVAFPFRRVLDGLSVSAIFDRELDALPWAGPLLQLLARAPGIADLPIVSRFTSVSPATWEQIERFRGLILSDGGLIDDLKPAGMAKLEATLERDHVPMIHYVTVAPRPAIGGDALRRAVYAASWFATERGASMQPLPSGVSGAWPPPKEAWLTGGWDEALGSPPRANDGVVPTWSQAVPGNEARFLRADHLDVVGHFAGGRSVTIFKSGASFGPAEFRKLWRDVASRL
jgi:hypothetical protein